MKWRYLGLNCWSGETRNLNTLFLSSLNLSVHRKNMTSCSWSRKIWLQSETTVRKWLRSSSSAPSNWSKTWTGARGPAGSRSKTRRCGSVVISKQNINKRKLVFISFCFRPPGETGVNEGGGGFNPAGDPEGGVLPEGGGGAERPSEAADWRESTSRSFDLRCSLSTSRLLNLLLCGFQVFTAVPEQTVVFKGETITATNMQTFEMKPRIVYPMEEGTALITFEDEDGEFVFLPDWRHKGQLIHLYSLRS